MQNGWKITNFYIYIRASDWASVLRTRTKTTVDLSVTSFPRETPGIPLRPRSECPSEELAASRLKGLLLGSPRRERYEEEGGVMRPERRHDLQVLPRWAGVCLWMCFVWSH